MLRMKSRFMSRVHPDSQECPIQILCGKLVVARIVQLTWNQACFWFVALREDDAVPMMNDSWCFVCVGLFNGTLLFCVSFDGSEFNNTSSISVISVAHLFTLFYDTFDGSTDAKSKSKFGAVSVTMEQHTEGRLQDSQSMLDRCVA